MTPAVAAKERAVGLGAKRLQATRHQAVDTAGSGRRSRWERWAPLGAVGTAGSGGLRWERSRPLGAVETAGSGRDRWERWRWERLTPLAVRSGRDHWRGSKGLLMAMASLFYGLLLSARTLQPQAPMRFARPVGRLKLCAWIPRIAGVGRLPHGAPSHEGADRRGRPGR